MTDYPWWEEVAANVPLMQGDLFEAYPVAVFNEEAKFDDADNLDSLLTTLSNAAGIRNVRAIIMTQACDLEQSKVRDVILCAAHQIDEYRRAWEATWTREHNGALPAAQAWDSHIKGIKAGRTWSATLLRKREPGDGVTLTTPTIVVDFRAIYSLPTGFLTLWTQRNNQPRLRLSPPYREHLSQAFARFFMRVGLPVDITDL